VGGAGGSVGSKGTVIQKGSVTKEEGDELLAIIKSQETKK